MLFLLFSIVWIVSLINAQPTYNPALFTFDILDPPFLAQSVAYLPAEFGSSIVVTPPSTGFTGEIVALELVNSQSFCNKTAFTVGQFSGKIVLGAYGGCSTITHIDTAVRVGAALAIYYGCPPGSCGTSAIHPWVDTASTINLALPTIMIDYKDGKKIVDAIKLNSSIVTVYIEGTNEILQEELDALKAFAIALPLGSPTYLNTIRYSSGLRNWTDLLSSDPNVIGDPCLNRVMGIWCLSGRVVELYSSDLNIQGELPSELGDLSSLRLIQFPQQTGVIRKINGTLPCSIGNLVNLQELRLPSNAISTLLADPTCWPSQLRAIDLSYNLLTELPSVLGTYATLRYVDFSNNFITNYINFQNSTGIEFLDLGMNQIVGMLESFSMFSNITKLFVDHNQLSAIDCRSFFNNLPYLTLIDLSHNNLTGGVPVFSNTRALITVDISYNNFTGSLPSSWSLPALTSLIYSHNSIGSFFPAIVPSQSLIEMDGSYNIWYSATPFLSVLLLPITTLRINLEHNNITGVWIPNQLSTRTKLQSLKLGSNFITGLPSTLFTELSGLQLADFSNNRLSGTVPSNPPGRNLLSAKFKGNPNLGQGIWKLPAYIQQDLTHFVSNLDQPFRCPTLIGATTDLVLEIDPTYYNYSGCACEPGTYGIAPDCSFIPDSAPINQDGGSITDAAYGDQRLQKGLFTVWPVSRQISPDQVKVVIFDISVNRSEFHGNQDVISIYEGDADLKGNRVFQLRGTDTEFSVRPSDSMPNTSFFQVKVFSHIATLSFQSRDIEGTHFAATVAFADQCPLGFTEILGTQCRKLVYYETEKYVVAPIYLFMGLGLLLMLTVLALVLVYLTKLIIRASSPLFCILTLMGLVVLTIAPVTYIQAPTSASTCHLRVWLTALPLVVILSNLLVKVDRIRNIFSTEVLANLQKKYRKFTNERLLITSGLMITFEIILLGIFSALGLSTPGVAEGPGTDTETLVQVNVCESKAGYSIWLGIQLAYLGVFILWGAYLAFLTKDTPTAFNESTHIFGCLLVLLFFGIILIPLNFMVADDPASLLLIRGIGQTFGSLLLTSILFGPKIYYLAIGRGDDKTMLQGSTQDQPHSVQLSIPTTIRPEAQGATGPEQLPSVVRMEASVHSETRERDSSMDQSVSGQSTTPPPNENTGFLKHDTILEGHEDMEVV